MSKTILAVDDSASMRQMVGVTLRAAGYEVIEASDGDEALEYARKHRVDLVLTDVNMPRMDGITLIAQLRTLAELSPDAVAAADNRVESGAQDAGQAGRCHRLDGEAVQSRPVAGDAGARARQPDRRA
jgi:two-component system, chemotaxis family, chemotaxis protein CheY